MTPDTPTAYPLAWPLGKKRTSWNERRKGAFSIRKETATMEGLRKSTVPVNIMEAVTRVVEELRRLGDTSRVVVSTNCELRKDGLPRGDRGEPSDPGVAVYFNHKKKPVVLACDRYLTVAMNVAAIAVHLSATRAIERHGVGTFEELFRGFTALPAGRDWRELLNNPADLIEAERAYRNAIKLCHPDLSYAHGLYAEALPYAEKIAEEKP